MKDIEGYEGLYAVSEDGSVWSHKRNRTLLGGRSAKGYYQVKLSKEGTQTMLLVHRLVAKAFIPNPDGKKTVNHKDGNKRNNCIHNLEWATYVEQANHAYNEGLNPRKRLSPEDIQAILALRGTMRQVDIAKAYGITQVYVSCLFRGERRKLLTGSVTSR